MVDSHCHLYELGDIGTEVQRFEEVGGAAIICAGAGVESSRRAVEIAKKYDMVWATVGIHPEENPKHEFLNSKQILKSELLQMINHKKVVGVGECGLDYHENTKEEEKKTQRELFKFNIEMARETNMPLVVHCRNAFEDVYDVVQSSKGTKVQGMMHCWTGSEEWMRKFVDLGWYISFGGILTFKNSRELRRVASLVPEDRLLVETDAPYLAPEPVRGTRNTPENVKMVLKCLTEVRSKDMAEITARNAMRLFKI